MSNVCNISKAIFITGTGTDVGKTFVSALIVKKLRESGLNAGYYKAAMSGAERSNDTLIVGDAEFVRTTAGLTRDANHMVSYIYETAISPHLAAQIERNPIEMDKLVSDFGRMKSECDYLTMEGSGGIVCPLRMDEKRIMLTDVIKAFGLSILIVAPSGLGAINAAILTVEYARSLDINIKGIILNQYEEGNFLHIDNKRQIAYLTGVPVIACVPQNATYLDMDADTLANLYKEIG